MSKGSLYHHFGDKFAYLAMLTSSWKRSFIYPLLQDGLDTSDFFDLLQKTMKATMDFMVADPRMHHLSNRLLEESVEFRNRLLSFYTPDYFQTFAAYVRQAVESGQIDSRYPPEFVAQVVEIMLSSVHKLVRTGSLRSRLRLPPWYFIKYGISRR